MGMYDVDTVAAFNNSEIHNSIRLLRKYPGDKYALAQLQDCLEQRRFYRSNEPVTVYLVDFGGDKVWFRTMADAQSWIDEMEWDEPPTVTTGIKTGREMGQMHCWEC